tara:strand:- start:509 stop:1285 length:777 start_codon:yes stop_codon:yes gene_type:complete
MIIDSHCHLEFDPLHGDLDAVFKRAFLNNVKYFLTISTKDSSFDKILQILKKYKFVYGTYGIHPHEAKFHKNIKSHDILKKVKISNKVIGIGESGLDYYYKNSEINNQKKIFIEHIKASQESNLPLVVHTRSAENDTYEILKSELKNKKLNILIHCFTGSKEFARKLLDIGCYISASGIVTFKNSKDLAETFKFIPNDRILVETDSPYLSPDPLRGKSNEPCNIIYTLKFLSKLKNLDENKFEKITTQNFFKLFGELS